MRAVKSVLNASGRVKRENKDMDETIVMIKAIRDMNLPKFIKADEFSFEEAASFFVNPITAVCMVDRIK